VLEQAGLASVGSVVEYPVRWAGPAAGAPIVGLQLAQDQEAEDRVSTQIFCFSGTGDSLHVARELQRRLPETALVPIISVLGDGEIETTAETVGLVFPIHSLTTPIPVKRFLEQVDVRSAKYVFAVATRLCSDKVFSDIDKMLEGQGKALDAHFSVEMPCTYIPLFTLPSEGTIARMEADLQKKLDGIQAVVASNSGRQEQFHPAIQDQASIVQGTGDLR
jgi:hypothetical protein